MKIARVFPRQTKATPDDDMTFLDVPPMLALPEIDEVHVSVAFTWDLRKAEHLARQWEQVALVKMGGPAFNKPGDNFIPGKYIKDGYVITSRGCHNKCWFCSVWKREDGIKELPIQEGWNVLDDNILACSKQHIESVFAMLKRQKHRAEFTGGLEARILEQWHVDLLAELRPSQMFFAYDTDDDYDPLCCASKMLLAAGFNRHHMRCYCLIGYPNDTMSKAEQRLESCVKLGYFPMAMLYRNKNGDRDYEWMKLQREWSRPAIIAKKMKQHNAIRELVC